MKRLATALFVLVGTVLLALRGVTVVALGIKVSYTFLQLVSVARFDATIAYKFAIYLVALGVLLAAAAMPYAWLWRAARSNEPRGAADKTSWRRRSLTLGTAVLLIAIASVVFGPPAAALLLLLLPYGQLVSWLRRRGKPGSPQAPAAATRSLSSRLPSLATIVLVEVAIAIVVLETTNPLFIRYHPTRFWQSNSPLANSQGLRGPVVPIDKPAGSFRIACIGDSVTWGHGMERAEDTYPIVLDHLLAERASGAPVTVMNGGVVGYSSYQGLVMLRDEVARYHPDLVIAYFGLHEMLVPEVASLDDYRTALPSPFERFLLQSGTVQLWLLGHWVHQRGYVRSFAESDRIEAMLQHNFRFNMDVMDQLGREQGFTLYWVIPMDWKDGQLRRVWPLDAWRPDRLLDAYPKFSTWGDRAGALFIDEVHFSVDGNRLMAEALSEALTERRLVP